MAVKIQIRRGTAAAWTSANPTLAAGEFGEETDTGKLKVGNGSTVWTALGYASISLTGTGAITTTGAITGGAGGFTTLTAIPGDLNKALTIGAELGSSDASFNHADGYAAGRFSWRFAGVEKMSLARTGATTITGSLGVTDTITATISSKPSIKGYWIQPEPNGGVGTMYWSGSFKSGHAAGGANWSLGSDTGGSGLLNFSMGSVSTGVDSVPTTNVLAMTMAPSGAVTIPGDLRVGSQNSGPLAGFRNRIINGGFDVWQRGTSLTGLGMYTSDRWYVNAVNGAYSSEVNSTVSKNADSTLRISTSGADTGGIQLAQAVELSQSDVGKTFTISAKIKKVAGATVTGGVRFQIRADDKLIRDGTNIGGGDLLSTMSTSNYTIYSATFTVPAFTTYLAVGPYFTAMGNTQTNTPLFDVAYVQLEPGSVATPFEARPIGVELALCQRYYHRRTSASAAYTIYAQGFASKTTEAQFYIPHPVQMRVSPTVCGISGVAGFITSDGNNNWWAPTVFAVSATPNLGMCTLTTVGPYTQGHSFFLCASNSTATWIEFSSEL